MSVNENILTDPDKLNILFRYLVKAASERRCVPYKELEYIFVFSHKYIAHYAGKIGDFCITNKLPLLNSLIISEDKGRSSKGFNSYEKKSKKNWGANVAKCFGSYKIEGFNRVKWKSNNSYQDWTSKEITQKINEFLKTESNC